MKISRMLFVLVMSLGVLAFGSAAWGQLLVEDFNYTPATSLNGQGGWNAHSGTGTNPPQVTSGGLTYPGYVSSGIANAASFTTTGEDVNKPYATFPNGTADGSLYYALMVKLDSAATTGDYFFHLGKNSSTFSARIFAKRAANGNIRFGIGKASAIANINFSDSIYTPGTTYLIAVKYTVIAGATNDTVALWVNPAIGSPEPAATVLQSAADRATNDVDSLYFVALRQGTASNAPIGTIDGIRVGTSWDVVVNGAQPPLSGVKTIGGTSPDYATIKAALTDLTLLGTTAPGVTFVIRDGTYNEDTLNIRTSTSSAAAPVVIKPASGATVVVNATPGGSGVPFGIRIDSTQYVTIDGSNNGSTSRDMTINALGTNGQRGVQIIGQSHYATVKNCIVTTGGMTSANNRAIDVFYYSVTGGNPNNVVIENNLLKRAYTGVRSEGNALGDLVNNLTIRNNRIDSIAFYGIYIWYTFNAEIYNNDITLAGGTSTVYGMYFTTNSFQMRVHNNTFRDFVTTSTSAGMYGIANFGTAAYSQNSYFNNFFWNFNPPSAGTNILYGIYLSGTNTTIPDTVAYNTVNFTGTGTGNKTTYCFYKASATGPAYLYNNVLKNTRTDGTTGIAVAVYKTSTATVVTSDFNDLYVGTPDAQHVTGRISTTNYSTLANWRTINSSDVNSIAADPPFVSATDLHIQTTVPTQLESGGTPVAGITTDIDGDTRNATRPDIGADEFAGIPLDLTAPNITYTPLPPTPLTGARTLTASITDASGVPTAGIGLPVLYWKRNSGSYSAATGTFVSGSNYSFTFGASGVVGDTISYYVAAQDNAGTPNVAVQPSAGASGLTPNPPAASTPPTSPSVYYIVQAPLAAGDYTVGLALFERVIGKSLVSQTFTRKVMREVPVGPEIDQKQNPSAQTATITPFANTEMREVEEAYSVLMENGQQYEGPTRVLFSDEQRGRFGIAGDVIGVYPTITAAVNDLNLRGVAGSIRFLLTDATYPSETFPITVKVLNDSMPTATKTVTIKPNTGVTATVAGASASSQIFKILNSYVSIDGANTVGGSTRNLTIQNTSTTSPQVVLFGSTGTTPIVGNALMNCEVINGVNTSTPVVVSDGTAAGTAGYFSNISLVNNKIRNCYIGMYSIAVVGAGNGSGTLVMNNDFTATATDSVRYVGVYMQGIDGGTVRGNNIGWFSGITSEDDKGVWFATGTSNSVVERNNIHDLNYFGTGGYGAHGVYVTTGMSPANIVVRNNMISHLSGDGWSYTSIPTDNTIGIAFSGTQTAVSAYYNSINLYGNTLNKASALSMGIYLGAGSVADLKNNLIVNMLGRLDTSATGLGYGKAAVYAATSNTQFSSINYNDYYVNAEANAVSAIGKISTTDYLTLTDWRTGSGGDLNSISANVTFLAPTDLHIDSTATPAVSNAGTPIAGITTDFDGQTRDITTPDIGADEFGLPSVALSGTYTVGTGGQFATIADAFTALQTNGVAGPVTLLLTNSEYRVGGDLPHNSTTPARARCLVDPLDPTFKGVAEMPTSDHPDTVGALILQGPITGASQTNRITMKPATGTSVTITSNGAAALALLDASYVTIDGVGLTGSTKLTINSIALGSAGVLMEGNSDNNILQNVTVRAPFANGTTVYLYADSATATPDSNLIQNNIIASGTDGVVILGNATSFPNANWISNNQIGTASDSIGETGVYVQQSNNTRINGNTIQNVRQVFTNVAGIWVATKHLNTRIWNNVVFNVKLSPTVTAAGFASGFYIFGTSTDVTSGDYYNNMVYDLDYLGTFTGGTVRGMYLSTGQQDTIAYNSIYLTGTATTNVTSGALYTSTHVGQVFRNNIAINNRTEMGTGRGMAFYKLSTTSTINSNYNDLYVPSQANSFIGGVGTANDTTLAKWRTRGYDSMSVSTTANFVPPGLHINTTIATPLDGGGTPVAGITADIDGDPRNVSTPDIGADEFVVGVFPPPVVSQVARAVRVPLTGDTLVVTCTITDTVGINTANILYASDGVAQPPVAMTRTSGTPTNGTYRGVLPGTANQNGKRIEYQIQANSSSSNSTTTPLAAANSYFAGVSSLSSTGVRSIDSVFAARYKNYYARLTGTINGPNFQATNLSQYFQDAVGGMNLFMIGNTSAIRNLGDSIVVVGRLDQFRGVIELIPDSAGNIQTVASNRSVSPISVTVAQYQANAEDYESRLIQFSGINRKTPGVPPWPPVGTQALITMYQTSLTDTVDIFINAGTNIPGSPEPTYPVTVICIGTQFAPSGAATQGGYEVLPRYTTDFSGPPVTGNWTAQSSGITTAIYSIKAVSPSVGWVAGASGRVLRTTNGGTNWTSVGGGAIGTADVYNVAALDASTAFVTTTPATTSFIYRTTDGGTTWTQVYSLAGGFIDAIHMFNSTNGIAYGDPVGGKWTIVKTSDGGATWVRDTVNAPVQAGSEAGWNNAMSVVGTTHVWFGTNNSRVYRSTDGGTTWTFASTPFANTYGLHFNDTQRGFSGGENGAQSLDGGATWTMVTTLGTGNINAVAGAGAPDLWYARGANVYRSTNNGATWATEYIGAGTQWHVNFTSAGATGWVGNSTGAIAKFSPTTGVGDGDGSALPATFALSQNYPNPFNPSTTIRYALPQEAAVQLKVYNVLGQEIAVLKDAVQAAGNHSVVWDGRNNAGAAVASGIYFYRLEARPADGSQKFTSFKKMIFLK